MKRADRAKAPRAVELALHIGPIRHQLAASVARSFRHCAAHPPALSRGLVVMSLDSLEPEPRWVAWRIETRDGKPTKARASVSDPKSSRDRGDRLRLVSTHMIDSHK